MITRCYSVFDLKAAAFMQPFFFARDEVAIRAFSDTVADPQSGFNKHPEDYQLFYIGEFDDESGILSGAERPVFLVNALGQVVS